MKCALCQKEILPGTAAVSVAGGLFPAEDPDFFAMDEGVMSEAFLHRDCFLEAARAFSAVSPPKTAP